MVKRQKKSLNAFTFRLTLAESQGFEPWVPFGDTAFRVLHLRPLGQLSMSQLYFTTFSLIFNRNFPWHSRSFQEVGEKKGGKNGITRKM